MMTQTPFEEPFIKKSNHLILNNLQIYYLC
jgi:hypothetical protein